jgi:hypothetical protein
MWRQLIFLHIPKTAGWALHAALLPIFGEAQSLRVNDGDDLVRLRALSPREFSRYRYVSGHFTYNDVKLKCRDDALFVSILRDPVRRLVSTSPAGPTILTTTTSRTSGSAAMSPPMPTLSAVCNATGSRGTAMPSGRWR